MAKVKYTDFLGDNGSLMFGYTPDQMHTVMDQSGDNKAVYLDESGGGKVILKGENFAYLDGDLLMGSVDKITFKDEDGNTTAVVSGVDFKAKQLDNLLTEGFNLTNFLDKIYSGKDTFTGTGNDDVFSTGNGNDRINGLGGDDSLNGQMGNDRMTGGGGSDFFIFIIEDGGGKDVVTDFDARGGGEKQDYIGGSIDDVLSIKQVGDDLVLNYGGGNTLTLLGVDKSDLSGADFAEVAW